LTLGLLAPAAISAHAQTGFTDANWVGVFGLPGTNDIIGTMVEDKTGKVYFGGTFTVCGTVIAVLATDIDKMLRSDPTPG
jgi:hypothetical protein